jgi:hypothetical protein
MTRDMDLVRKILLEMEASPNGFVEIRALGVARGDKFRAVCHLTLSTRSDRRRPAGIPVRSAGPHDTLSDTITGGRRRKRADELAAQSIECRRQNTAWTEVDGHQSFC